MRDAASRPLKRRVIAAWEPVRKPTGLRVLLHVWTAPLAQEGIDNAASVGFAHVCRLFDTALMAAGPDEVHGSGLFLPLGRAHAGISSRLRLPAAVLPIGLGHILIPSYWFLRKGPHKIVSDWDTACR